MSNSNIRILYLGPQGGDTHDASQTEQQSRAVLEYGAEFVRYAGSSEGELIEALQDADCAINQGHGWDPSLFAHMGNNGRCKGLVSFGHGYDGMDLQTAAENGVVLSNTASFGTEEVSNHTMMHFLVCARKFVLHDKLVKSGEWTRQHLPPMGHISGQTFGIVGLGNIGRAVARKARAFNMNIIAHDPYLSSWDAKEYGVDMVRTPHEIARESDYVSAHIFLNDETYHMFNADFFRAMKPTAYFINCSRGPTHDEEALIEALQTGQIAGAGLDVFEQEPIDPNNPLLSMDNVSVTNHYASYSEVAWERANTQLGEEAIRIATGYWPMSLINPEVKHHAEARKDPVDWLVMV